MSTIYEVKSGKARHKAKQYLAQKELANSLGKDHVVYSPGSSDYQLKVLQRMGIKIFNNIEEFYESEKKKK